MKKTKCKIALGVFLGLTSLLLIVLMIPSVRSMAVMKVFSYYEYQHSVIHEEGLSISIPGGKNTEEKDWYPFVMTYNGDQGFSRFVNEDMRLTILYNFGHFPLLQTHSNFYNPDSPYYTSFYGGYGVRRVSGEVFGFEKGKLLLEELVQVLEFDLTRLVLRDLGKENPHFVYEVISIEEVLLFDEKGWYRVDGNIETNGVNHQYQENRRNYIQYGKPPNSGTDKEDFPIIEMNGRMYVKYDADKELTLAFYCLSREIEVIEDWEDNILRQTEITKSSND